MSENLFVVVPWRNESQIRRWCLAWGVPEREWEAESLYWLVLQWDRDGEGCARTKNKGVAEALQRGADVVVVLDDDCFPTNIPRLTDFAEAHRQALEPQPLERFAVVTDPPSRGTPYGQASRWAAVPVAASMGFWEDVGDYCAPGQLIYGPGTMRFRPECRFHQYFPLSGMNLAFRPREWLPWCQFIDVPRFDDIWMGWLWQKEAYRRGCCFNLDGPRVRHVRQSNVWKNLRAEAVNLERNETLWRDIALSPETDYEKLKALI